jgi:hypothetical protein
MGTNYEWLYNVYAKTSDVDKFVHDLMHLAWMLEK